MTRFSQTYGRLALAVTAMALVSASAFEQTPAGGVRSLRDRHSTTK
jgi:hypothetical protein